MTFLRRRRGCAARCRRRLEWNIKCVVRVGPGDPAPDQVEADGGERRGRDKGGAPGGEGAEAEEAVDGGEGADERRPEGGDEVHGERFVERGVAPDLFVSSMLKRWPCTMYSAGPLVRESGEDK